MPLSVLKEIEISASELKKLANFCTSVDLPKRYLIKAVAKLDKLEAMVLDSAFKDLDLVKLRDTILVLPDPYLHMLQKATIQLLLALKLYIHEN